MNTNYEWDIADYKAHDTATIASESTAKNHAIGCLAIAESKKWKPLDGLPDSSMRFLCDLGVADKLERALQSCYREGFIRGYNACDSFNRQNEIDKLR